MNEVIMDYSKERFKLYARIADDIKKIPHTMYDDIDITHIIEYQTVANQLSVLSEKKSKISQVSPKRDLLKLLWFIMKLYPNKKITISENSIYKKIDKIRTQSKDMYLLTGIRGDNLEICMRLIKSNGGHAFTSEPLTAITLKKNNIPHNDLYFLTYQLSKHIPNSFGYDTTTNNAIQKYIALCRIIQRIVSNNGIRKIISYEDSFIQKVYKNLNIPCITIESLILDNNPISALFFKSDKICVYGMQGKMALMSYGVPESKIYVTGNPILDILSQNISYQKKKKMILYCPSRIHNGDDLALTELSQYCKKNNYELIVKLHPKYVNSKLQLVRKIKNVTGITYHQDIQVQKLILQCDILITDYSSTGIHSQILGIPTYFCNFNNDDLTNKPPYITNYTYNSMSELISKLDFSRNNHMKEKFIDDFNWKNDGMALERIIGVINET